MKQPVHFLTRSDVFKNRIVRSILQQLQMIPVYRIRDGKDKLSLNELSFRLSCEALAKGQHVMIFVEGFCENQTTLQPLKKGAARIMMQSWREGTSAQLMPLWLRYDSFDSFPKEIDIMPGTPFGAEVVTDLQENGTNLQLINKAIEEELLRLSLLKDEQQRGNRKWLFPFAMMGVLLHALYYFPIHRFAKSKMGQTIHFDSVLFALLALLYPFWILLMGSITACIFCVPVAIIVMLLMPLMAKAYVSWKR